VTTTPGALPLPAIRQAALELMRVRQVVAIHIRTKTGECIVYRQDVSESDDWAAKVLCALRGPA
jgi:hypothetical protein